MPHRGTQRIRQQCSRRHNRRRTRNSSSNAGRRSLNQSGCGCCGCYRRRREFDVCIGATQFFQSHCWYGGSGYRTFYILSHYIYYKNKNICNVIVGEMVDSTRSMRSPQYFEPVIFVERTMSVFCAMNRSCKWEQRNATKLCSGNKNEGRDLSRTLPQNIAGEWEKWNEIYPWILGFTLKKCMVQKRWCHRYGGTKWQMVPRKLSGRCDISS